MVTKKILILPADQSARAFERTAMPHTRFEKIRLDANQEHDREIPSKTGLYR